MLVFINILFQNSPATDPNILEFCRHF